MELTEKIMTSCPWRKLARHDFICKALIGQPNGSMCKAENCAMLYMAGLLLDEIQKNAPIIEKPV